MSCSGYGHVQALQLPRGAIVRCSGHMLVNLERSLCTDLVYQCHELLIPWIPWILAIYIHEASPEVWFCGLFEEVEQNDLKVHKKDIESEKRSKLLTEVKGPMLTSSNSRPLLPNRVLGGRVSYQRSFECGITYRTIPVSPTCFLKIWRESSSRTMTPMHHS